MPTLISSKDTVLILDDLVATGGTVEATGKLVRDMGAKLIGYGCILELAFSTRARSSRRLMTMWSSLAW